MSEVDQEYIMLVKSYLPKEAKVSWIKTGNNGQLSFYQFLEEQSLIAKKLNTDHSIISALSGNK